MANLDVPASAEAWTPPDFSDLERVARALASVAPEGQPIAPLSILGEGFFSVAVATASGHVFRLATAPGVMERYRKEARLLPWLRAGGLPLAAPEPRWLIEPGEAFPFGGMGYSMLPGVRMTADLVARGDRGRLVEDIAGLLRALHSMPLDGLEALGVPGPELEHGYMREWHEASMVVLPSLLTAAEMRVVARWWERFLEVQLGYGGPRVLVHRDIGDENLLASEDGSRLVGVIDWEHAAVTDPMYDFAHLRFTSLEFQREVMEAYRALGGSIDGGMRERLEWNWQMAPFPGLRRAWLRGEPIDVAAFRVLLRRHGVLDGSER